MLSSDVLCLKKRRKKKTYSLSSKIKEKQKKRKRRKEERCKSGDGTTTAMLQVTEDTPPDMLSGAMDLTVHLPNGRAVKMAVERSTPMMDLLVQITTAHRLQLSGHTLEPLGMSGEDVALPYKPNTPIGTLDTRRVRVVPKQSRAAASTGATGAAVVPRNVPPGQRPFESTFRLKVHLPRNQLYVTRVSRDVTLGEVVAKVCDEKDLDAAKYELRHPANLDQVLDLKRSLSDYKITEIYVVCRGSNDLNRAFSTNDIMALRKEEERKQLHTKTGGGVFNLIFRRGAAKSSIGSGSVSSDARSISPAPSDESRSVTPPQPVAPPPQAPPKPPTRKRRQAPPPPPQAAGAGPGASGAGPPEPQICHSRNSSDSSGYHEASVLSDTLPRRPRSAFVAADGAARAEPGAEGEEPRGAGLSKGYSRSTTNLSKMAYHSKSTTSLGVPPGRKKKAAPPPPPAILRASNPTINVEPASPIAVVASRAVATPTDAVREDQHACPVVAPQAPQVVVANAPPVPRSRLSRPAPAPRGRRVDVVAEEAQHQVAPEKPARQRATSPGSESPTEPPGHQVEPEGHLERPKTSGSSPREEIPSTTGQSEDPINVTKDPAVSAISDTKKDLENPSQTPPVDECRISDTRSDLENPSTTSPVDESPISYTKSNLENPIEAQSVDESNAKSALENPRITPPADECPISDTTSDLKNPNKTSPVDESPITYTNSDLENPTEAQTVDKSPITYTKIDLENPTEAQSVAESTISYTTSNLKNPSQTPSLDHSPNNLQQRFEPEPTRPKVAVIGALQKKTSRDIFSSAEFLVAGAPPPEVDLLEDDVVVYAGAKRPSSASHAGHGVESPPERYSRTTSVTSLRSLLGQPGGLKKWRNVEDLDDVSTASWTAGDQSETESFSSHQLDSLVSISSGHDVPRCFGSTDSGIAQELADHRATSPPPPPLLDDLPPSPPPPPPGVEYPRSSTRAPELTRVETPALEVVPPPPLPEPDDPTPPPPPGVVSPRSSALAPEVTRVETPAFEVVPPPPLLPEPSPPPPPPLDLPVDVVSDEQDAAWPPSPPRAFRDEEAAPVPVVERPELAARLLELQEAETPMNKLSLENLERRRSLVYNREIANSLKMADTFSGSISRFESTYAEVHRRSAATTTTTTSTSSSTTHLPNFRISTYDRPKERIKVFEDDTVRSNANATPWTPSRPVSRSRSQVALNGRHQVEEEKVVVERAPAGREGVSRSNSLYDVSGLQSLGVMRLIQTKLGVSLNRDDAVAAATPASLDAAPQVRPTAAYRYRGPPTVNMGTWSDRPKGGPVSVQGDAAVSSRLVVSTRSDSMPGGDVAVVTRGPRPQDPYRRRPLGALQADVSRVPPIVRSVELKKPFRDLEEAATATAKRSEGPGPVVRGFRTGYPWATLPRREEAVRVPSAPAPPPPTMPQEATRRRSVPREDARDQLLSAIRNFGGKKGLRSVNA